MDAYLTPVQWLTYYDKRRLLQLASDSGTPIAEADLSNTLSAGYLLVNQLLIAASSLIDSRCQVGKRYARTDLEGIINGTDARQKALLQQMTADLAWGDLMARRGYSADAMQTLAPRYNEALQLLEQLYQGMSIFDLDAPKNAGVPSVDTLGKNRLIATDFSPLFGTWPDARYRQNPYWPFGYFGH